MLAVQIVAAALIAVVVAAFVVIVAVPTAVAVVVAVPAAAVAVLAAVVVVLAAVVAVSAAVVVVLIAGLGKVVLAISVELCWNTWVAPLGTLAELSIDAGERGKVLVLWRALLGYRLPGDQTV